MAAAGNKGGGASVFFGAGAGSVGVAIGVKATPVTLGLSLVVFAGAALVTRHFKKLNDRRAKLAKETRDAIDFVASKVTEVDSAFNALTTAAEVGAPEIQDLQRRIAGLHGHINHRSLGKSLYDLDEKKKKGLPEDEYNDAKAYYQAVNQKLGEMNGVLESALKKLTELEAEKDTTNTYG